jgi:hypothetical protein
MENSDSLEINKGLEGPFVVEFIKDQGNQKRCILVKLIFDPNIRMLNLKSLEHLQAFGQLFRKRHKLIPFLVIEMEKVNVLKIMMLDRTGREIFSLENLRYLNDDFIRFKTELADTKEIDLVPVINIQTTMQSYPLPPFRFKTCIILNGFTG